MSPSVTASAADSLVISFVGSDSGGLLSDLSAGTNCILDAQGTLDGVAVNDRVAMEHKSVGAGSVSLTWTNANQFGGQVHIAVFKALTDVPAGDAGPTLIRLIGNRQTW